MSVDDILIFGHGLVKELEKIKELLDLYCKATGMVINMNNYILLCNELVDDAKTQIELFFQ
jgi:hypothetical protein